MRFNSALLLALLYAPAALPSAPVTTLECNVQNPCGWTETLPGEPAPRLNYCIGSLVGDRTEMVLTLNFISPEISEIVKMPVVVGPFGEISAQDKAGRFSLNLENSAGFYRGGLVEESQKLGFFTSCEEIASPSAPRPRVR